MPEALAPFSSCEERLARVNRLQELSGAFLPSLLWQGLKAACEPGPQPALPCGEPLTRQGMHSWHIGLFIHLSFIGEKAMLLTGL